MSTNQTVALLVVTACLAVWGGLWLSGNFKRIEAELMNARFAYRGPIQSKQPIIYVNLDSETSEAFGTVFMPRNYYAYVADAALSLGKADRLFFDFTLERIPEASEIFDEAAYRAQVNVLSQVIQAYPDQILLAAHYSDLLRHDEGRTASINDLDPIWRGDSETFDILPSLPQYPLYKPKLSGAGTEGVSWGQVGLINTGFDESGLPEPRYVPVRSQVKISTLARWLSWEIEAWDWETVSFPGAPSNQYETLMTVGLALFLDDEDSFDIQFQEGRANILNQHGGLYRSIPLVEGKYMEINWYSPWSNVLNPAADPEVYLNDPYNPMVSMKYLVLRYFEYHEAIDRGEEEKAELIMEWFRRAFEGRVVLVGPTDPLLQDVSRTPMDVGLVPRVSVHGNVLKMLADERFITRPPAPIDYLLLALMITMMAFSFGQGESRLLRSKFLGIGLLLLYVLFSFEAFRNWHLVLPLFVPVAASLNAGIFLLAWRLGMEEKQKRHIQKLFGTYVSPELVKIMVTSAEAPKLGGESEHITAFFSDIQSFSSLAEKMNPTQLVMVMNSYLDAMSQIIEEEGGTLDKYIGDAIIAIFGAPVQLEDHAVRAIRAAVRIQERQLQLCEEWRKKHPDLPSTLFYMRTRIGLNSGDAVVGNMGSTKRFTYTMMGDTVNLASRSESGARQYGVHTFVTGTTLNAAAGGCAPFLFRIIDKVVVSGRSDPELMYQVYGYKDRASSRTRQCYQLYETAFGFYQKRNWDKAAELFEEASKLEEATIGQLNPSIVMAMRCRRFSDIPPPEDWNGQFMMIQK